MDTPTLPLANASLVISVTRAFRHSAPCPFLPYKPVHLCQVPIDRAFFTVFVAHVLSLVSGIKSRATGARQRKGILSRVKERDLREKNAHKLTMSFYLHIIVASFIFLSCCRGPSHKKAFDRNYPERAFTKVQFMTVKPEFASERLVQGNSGHGKLNLNKFNKGLFLNDSQVDSFLAIINDSSSFSPADLITCTKEAVLLFLDDNNDIVARMELGCSYSVFAFSPPIGPRNYLPLTEKADNQFDSILQSLNQNP